MTNHIEQLMKAAGVKPYKRSYFECKGGRSTICLCPQIGVPNAWCKEDCNGEEMQEKVEYFYPVFTPEKQLELIKLIGQQSGFQIHQNEGMDWLLSDSIYADLSFNTQGYSYSSFENALCKLTINLLKKKALNKSEVKRILEDE